MEQNTECGLYLGSSYGLGTTLWMVKTDLDSDYGPGTCTSIKTHLQFVCFATPMLGVGVIKNDTVSMVTADSGAIIGGDVGRMEKV